jgi:hypothetical protein
VPETRAFQAGVLSYSWERVIPPDREAVRHSFGFTPPHGALSMLQLLIPWRVFLKELSKQSAQRRPEWLEWWLFDDAGVVLLRNVSMAPGEAQRELFHPFYEKRQRLVLSRIISRKLEKITH